MENPTTYRGYTITYVINDVAPDTLTACIWPPDGSRSVQTSERIFRDRAAWHRDIRAKIDAAEPTHDPSKSPPEVDPLTVLSKL